jgi:hypothetical protein
VRGERGAQPSNRCTLTHSHTPTHTHTHTLSLMYSYIHVHNTYAHPHPHTHLSHSFGLHIIPHFPSLDNETSPLKRTTCIPESRRVLVHLLRGPSTHPTVVLLDLLLTGGVDHHRERGICTHSEERAKQCQVNNRGSRLPKRRTSLPHSDPAQYVPWSGRCNSQVYINFSTSP